MVGTARDLQLAYRAKRAGAKHSLRIILEARAAGIPPSWAFALVEQESGFKNVFGHDRGGMFPGEPVTRQRVRMLLAGVANGQASNGVGLTQLTYPPLIKRAEHRGGAHIPRHQLSVGFEYLAATIDHGRAPQEAWRYNGARSYQRQIEAKQRYWHAVLTKGTK